MSHEQPEQPAPEPASLPDEDETDPQNAAVTADPTSAASDGRTGPRPDLPHTED